MVSLQDVINLIDVSKIAQTFKVDSASFLMFIVGSFMVGAICLVTYYVAFEKNKIWSKLKLHEQGILSLVVGIMTTFNGLLLWGAIMMAIRLAAKILGKNPQTSPFEGAIYLMPFVFFWASAKLFSGTKRNDLVLIRSHINWFLPISLLLMLLWVTFAAFYLSFWLGFVSLVLFVFVIFFIRWLMNSLGKNMSRTK